MHLWQCAKHKCSISAFCCYSKTSFHLKVYKFLDREGRFQASKCSQKVEIQNQSRHLLFRQTGETQMPALFPFCLLRQSAEGQTAVYFSLAMFIWNQTRDRSLGTFFFNQCLLGLLKQNMLRSQSGQRWLFQGVVWTWCHLLDPKQEALDRTLWTTETFVSLLSVCASIFFM